MIRSKKEDPKVPASVELEKISYIEDAELNKYILSAKERRFKTALWELINRDYLEVATAASEQTEASVDRNQICCDSLESQEKKIKRGQDCKRSNQGEVLPNKALEQDAKKKKVKSSVSSDPDIINDATENCNEEEIHEFTFVDD